MHDGAHAQHSRPDKPGRIAVLATLDTKHIPAARLGDLLHRQPGAAKPWFIDTSIGSDPVGVGTIQPDTTRSDLLAAAGLDRDTFDRLPKTIRMERLADAAAGELAQLIRAGTITAVIGLGGGQGTWLSLRVMEQLPPSVTRILVTTSPQSVTYNPSRVGIIIVPSVSDIAGTNSILDKALAAAAGAAVGGSTGCDPSDESLIALTMFGVTTRGAEYAREAIERSGTAVAVFHANGLGGAAMERLLESAGVTAVLDWSTTEITDEVVGGVSSAGPDRLTTAGRLGLPQVVVPGAVDVVNFRGPSTIPDMFRDRRFHNHTPTVTLMRTAPDEAATIATTIARRLNEARGPVSVLIPSRGFSALDAPGEPFWDPAADAAFTDTLRATLDPRVPVHLIDLHINDPEFGRAAAAEILCLATARADPTS